MDIFAHALWTAALIKGLSLQLKRKITIWKAVLWGIAPDVFSFGLLTAWLILSLVFGGTAMDFQQFEAMEPAQRDTIPVFQIVSFMYNFTHSIFVFAAFFIIFYFIFRRPLLAMLGWLVHILIDIPTHSYKFYPTPFLWPISEWKFNGISWGQPWFMALNYTAIVSAYLFLYVWNRKSGKPENPPNQKKKHI
ncbi:MAG: metal-dependent hydrolase [Nanoarchaeota archaeon]|nr:metal-dependent hydrolase [Nanoarchaeota archaeon]